jgi:hypothetical protein
MPGVDRAKVVGLGLPGLLSRAIPVSRESPSSVRPNACA